MNCPKCNAELYDGAVVCSACGEHFAVELQRGKFLAARANTKNIFENICRSRIFLVLSVFLSILCGASGVSLLRSLILWRFDLYAALVFAFSLVAIITAWSLYSGKSKADGAQIKKMRMLNTLLRVFANIIYICMIVAFVCLIICIPFVDMATDYIAENASLKDVMDQTFSELYHEGIISLDDYNTLMNEGFEYFMHAIFIIGAILCAVVAVLYAFFASAYKKADVYIKGLEKSASDSEYRIERVPNQFLFAMGIVQCVIALFSLSSDLLSGLESGSIGACMIITALIFKKIHEEQTRNNAVIAAEEAELIRVSSLTNDYVMREAQMAAQRAREAAEAAQKATAENTSPQATDNTSSNEA